MGPKYNDMFALFEDNTEARQYFENLPDYVREQIKTRANNVNSLESLQDYAENLLRGDN